MTELSGNACVEVEGDVAATRKLVRRAAESAGMGLTDVTRVVTACSELARNMFLYAGGGDVCWEIVEREGRKGLELTFRDTGPGIANVEEVLEDGYSTGGSMGMGLPGSKRLMDDMEIRSEVGVGTTIIVAKWLR